MKQIRKQFAFAGWGPWAIFDGDGRCIMITSGGLVDAAYMVRVSPDTDPSLIRYDIAHRRIVAIQRPVEVAPPPRPLATEEDIARLQRQIDELKHRRN